MSVNKLAMAVLVLTTSFQITVLADDVHSGPRTSDELRKRIWDILDETDDMDQIYISIEELGLEELPADHPDWQKNYKEFMKRKRTLINTTAADKYLGPSRVICTPCAEASAASAGGGGALGSAGSTGPAAGGTGTNPGGPGVVGAADDVAIAIGRWAKIRAMLKRLRGPGLGAIGGIIAGGSAIADPNEYVDLTQDEQAAVAFLRALSYGCDDFATFGAFQASGKWAGGGVPPDFIQKLMDMYRYGVEEDRFEPRGPLDQKPKDRDSKWDVPNLNEMMTTH